MHRPAGRRPAGGRDLLRGTGGAAAAPLPLLAADALDGLASLVHRDGSRLGPELAAAAFDLRSSRGAARWGGALALEPPDRAAEPPSGWVVAGQLTRTALTEVADALERGARDTTEVVDRGANADTRLAVLTRTERVVADKVAEGLTSRQIAAVLFVSPGPSMRT